MNRTPALTGWNTPNTSKNSKKVKCASRQKYQLLHEQTISSPKKKQGFRVGITAQNTNEPLRVSCVVVSFTPTSNPVRFWRECLDSRHICWIALLQVLLLTPIPTSPTCINTNTSSISLFCDFVISHKWVKKAGVNRLFIGLGSKNTWKINRLSIQSCVRTYNKKSKIVCNGVYSISVIATQNCSHSVPSGLEIWKYKYHNVSEGTLKHIWRFFILNVCFGLPTFKNTITKYLVDTILFLKRFSF